MRPSPFVVYSAGRLGVFAVVAGLLFLVGFRSWALALVALVVSMPLSYVVLRRQRTAFALDIERRRRKRRELRARLSGEEPDTE